MDARKLAAVLAFSAISAPALAWAQVNTEALRPNLLKPGWSGDAEGNLALSRGNIELFDLGGSGRILYQTLHQPEALVPFLRHRVFLAANGRFAERTKVNFVNQGFLHLRWSWMIHERIGPEVFTQYQFNQFLRLQTRALLGGGLRVDVIHTEPMMVWGGTGAMLEFNRINVEPGASDRPETLEYRWANYLTVRAVFLEEKLRVQSTIYLQPRFDKLSDFRLLNDLEVSAKITEKMSMGTSLSVLHDSAPPTGVKPTDLRLVSNARFAF